MKINGQRGTVAGLVMIGLALAWAVFDATDRDISGDVGMTDTSQERTATRNRRVPSSHYRTPDEIAYRGDQASSDQDFGSQRIIPEEAKPQHRTVSRSVAGLNDTALLNRLSSSRKASHTKRKLAEKKNLKAIRLGAKNSESLISLDQALAAVDPEGEIAVTSSQRAEAIRALAFQHMDSTQIQAAYQFVEKGTPPEGLSESTYRWLSDELFIALRNQENVPSDLVQRLSAVANNTEQDAVLRDYALQHLGHYHEESGQDLEAIEQTLWEATSAKEGTIAGTALIALTNAQDDGRMVSGYNLQDRAMSILQGDYTEESKISALEILRGNQSEAVTTLVQSLATSEETPVALKIKATNQL